MNIYESAEDYLERILILQERNKEVRSIDIAHDMGFSKPSISVAMKKLKEAGLIKIDDNGFITLTTCKSMFHKPTSAFRCCPY